MKTSVRFLSMLLAIVMIASMAITVSAAKVTTVDPLELTEKESVELLVAIEAMQGDEHGNLNLDEKVTRAEAAKIVTVLTTTFTDVGSASSVFSDVPASHWASGYISYLVNKKVVGGYGDGTYGVNDNVTFDQTLKMLGGALGYDVAFTADWEVNTRMLARSLDIGQALVGVVPGGQALTRGQFAIAAVDAMFADMNQTKKITIPVGDFEIPSEAPMTLYEDVWMFETQSAAVVATSDFSVSELFPLIEDEDKDITVQFEDGTVKDYSFEELKVSSVADANELLLGNVKVFLDTEGEIIRSSITATGEEAEVTLDDDKEIVYINGVEVVDLEEGTEEDEVLVLSFNETYFGLIGIASYDGLSMILEQHPFKCVAYNVDGDEDYEMLALAPYLAVEIQSVTEKKVTANHYGILESVEIIDADKFIGTVEEDDVAVICSMYGKYYAQVIEPLVAAAEKYTSKKLTLAGTEYEINTPVFNNIPICMIDNTVIQPDSDGNLVENEYYIWDGKIFGSSVISSDTGLNFAVLTYINEPSDAVLNTETMQEEVEYTALVTINGKQETVNLDPDSTINGLALSNAEDKEFILASFGKAFTNDGEEAVEGGKYVLNRHILVKYTVDDDGLYSFNTVHETNEDYTVIPGGATISVDEKTGLYTIASGEEIVTKIAVIDPTAILYYTYKEEDTGAYLYLGSYTEATLPANMVEMTTTAPLYIYEDEETGLINIKLTMIDNEEIVLDESDAADFRTDGRLAKYAYYNANEILGSDGESVYYEHYFADPATGANISAVQNLELSIEDGAVNTSSGAVWTWDEANKKYIKVNKSSIAEYGIECITLTTLDSVINGCMITEAGSKYSNGVFIPADATIWSYAEFDTTTKYTKRSLDEVADMLEIAKENGEDIEVIIFTYLDDKKEEVVFSVFVDWCLINSYDQFITFTPTIFNSFNG